MEVDDRAPNTTNDIQAEKITPEQRKRSHKRSIAIVIVVSILNVGLLALLWSQLTTPAQPSASSPSNSVSPLVGHPAPDFTLAALSPHPAPAISLSSYKGKPVVLNVWASWCGPCSDEAPLLQSAWLRQQSKGIVFLGIDFQDTQTDGLYFLQKYAITYPNVIDASGSVAINYGVTGTPETIFIDRHGVVVSKVASELTEQTLESNLQLLSR